MKEMRKIIPYITLLLLSAFAWTSCEVEDPELGPVPTPSAEQATFTYSYGTNPNIVTFKSTAPEGAAVQWEFDGGSTVQGREVTRSYPLKGEYTVKMTFSTPGGSASSTKTVPIAATNPAMLNREDYNFLTGGISNLQGKTWVIDRENGGHLALGPITSSTPEWYSAGPNEKASEGYYDDEMVFNLNNNLAYTYDNKGTTFTHGASAAGLGGVPGGDHTLVYTPPTGMQWNIVEEGDKKFLEITKNGFIGYYTGVSRYEILRLTETELYIKFGSTANAEHGWYQRLVPKGFSKPVPPKEYKAADLNDDFDSPGNFTWKMDNALFNESFDNPAQVAANPSDKVARYIKEAGQGKAFSNVFIELPYKIDLRQRKVFKVKVFLPSYNDYTTMGGAEDWSPVKTLQKQLAVKLQNSELGGNSWTTQAEIIQQVTVMDQWVELTFDFSNFDQRQDFDKIVIQFGGEAHFNPGIFYLDDFRLMP
ncbi:PKD domain-containing protein [Rufibacter sp. LB8]|uniref:PKD domain-containing protein n=1 Tax=Rufibacter sp. LB8 TaxID=2777781 RepID=UPI00178C7E91|nr:PKD domain-containing protein [Rufibacter sp. LB8]